LLPEPLFIPSSGPRHWIFPVFKKFLIKVIIGRSLGLMDGKNGFSDTSPMMLYLLSSSYSTIPSLSFMMPFMLMD